MAVGQLGAITRGQESFRLPNLVSPSEQLIPSSHTHEITNSQQLGNSSRGRKATPGASLPSRVLGWMHTSFPRIRRQLVNFFEKQLAQSCHIRWLSVYIINEFCQPSFLGI